MKVTQYQRQVKTNAVSGHKLTLPEDTFGKSIAKGLGDVGTALGGVAVKLKQEADDTASKEGYTLDRRELDNALFGQNGFMSQMGANANGVTTKFEELARNVIEKGEERLQNNAQKQMYRTNMNSYVESVRRSLLNHEAQQGRLHKDASDKAYLNGLSESAVFSVGQSEVFYKNMGDLVTGLGKRGYDSGLRGDALKNYVDQNVSNTVSASIQYALATSEDPSLAIARFDEAKKRGMLTGAAIVQLSATINPIVKAQQSKQDAAVLSEDLYRSKTPEHQLGKMLQEIGYTTPELEKKLEGITDPRERDAIYAQAGNELNIKSEGDIGTAFRMALYDQGMWNGESAEEVGKKADALATKFSQNPSLLTPLTRREAMRMVEANPRTAGRTPEEKLEIAKNLENNVIARIHQEDQRRVNQIKSAVYNVDHDRVPVTTGLTPKQVTAINFYRTYAKQGTYDLATEGALWDNTAQLALMSDGDFEAVMLTVRPEVAVAMRKERERLLDPNADKTPPKREQIRQIAMDEIYRSNPDLALEENKAAREVLLSDAVERAMIAYENTGRALDRKELIAIVHGALPSYIGRPDLSMFQSEEALEQNPKMHDTLKDVAEVLGVDPSNPYALVQLGQRIQVGDGRLKIPKKSDIEQLLSQDEKRQLLKQEKNWGAQLNSIELLQWIITTRAGATATRQNTLGLQSDNSEKIQRIETEVY